MTTDPSPATLRVALEIGQKWVFATALDWPGWCRRGKGEQGALDALLDYAPRYAAVIARAGLELPADPIPEIVERLPGGAGTEFGAPGVAAADEARPTTADEAARLAAVMAACWTAFDEIAAAAPESLRKGPRGGGRDRSKIVEHVVECDRGAYAPKLGLRHRPFPPDDREALTALRNSLLAILGKPSGGPLGTDKRWTTRFATRYMAWHVLDHAWEIEDRSA
jgi:hypothetical protein